MKANIDAGCSKPTDTITTVTHRGRCADLGWELTRSMRSLTSPLQPQPPLHAFCPGRTISGRNVTDQGFFAYTTTLKDWLTESLL